MNCIQFIELIKKRKKEKNIKAASI